MLDMRRATKIGKPMRGDLRYGAPPESVSASQLKADNPEVIKLVSFDENFVRGTDPLAYPEAENEATESLEFSPNQCFAATSWDIWSFGLIMGQLVLGQSMVLLPNFEKASDAHVKNLYHYDDSAVKVRNRYTPIGIRTFCDLVSLCTNFLPSISLLENI